MAKQRSKGESLKVQVNFREREDGESPPALALYRLGPHGRPQEKVATADDGVLVVPKDLARRAPLVALGPDVEDPSGLERSTLLTYRAEEAVARWSDAAVIDLPRLRWTPWWRPVVCVSGTVQKCWVRPVLTLPRAPLSPLSPRLGGGVTARPAAPSRFFPALRCAPLCNGTVDVYERVCCCRWWDFVPRIPELIPELIPIPDPWPPPLPGPRPDPVPGPRPDPGPGGPRSLAPRQVARGVRSYQAEVEPSRRVPLAPRVESDLRALQRMRDSAEIYAYVVDRPYLLPVFCRCSSRKVGETPLNVDGSFSFCYPRGLWLRSCTVTYFYKVRQSLGGTWVTVYDGDAARAYFSAGESAELTTFNVQAETCTPPSDPPVDGHGRPFVLLQSIGTTDSHRLHSPLQTSLSAVTGADNSGLLDQSYSAECPLGGTLDLLLWIDPNLEGLGATYYRFSLAETNAAGAIVPSTLQRLDQSVSWRRWANGVWPPAPENVALGPVDPSTVGGEVGLIRIPYYSDTNRWLGNQYHYRLNTTAFSNGRYVLVVEIFDAAGTRLRPAGATGTGTDAAFHYVHWDTAGTTSVVDYAQLLHVLHLDNTACFADIEDLRKDGIKSVEECQFKTGVGSSQFSVGYRAYHVNDFMHAFSLTYQRGLNGTGTFGTGTLASGGSANQPPTLGAGNPAVSPGETFGHLLGDDGDGPEHQKCTFSLELYVSAKHTDGDGRLVGYDAQDDASFALEITP